MSELVDKFNLSEKPEVVSFTAVFDYMLDIKSANLATNSSLPL